jgi:SAM-dependent methyltransferase
VAAVPKPADHPLQRTRGGAGALKDAWEQHAEKWIAWAREPGHDSYWQFHRDLFLELVPEPRGRTLDLGCGEGRLARDLAAGGHDVVGVDASPTMIAAARDAAPAMELHVADAAALPLADESFELVVAFMSLQDVDDLEGAVLEAARVLRRGGRFCMAIVHPVNSAGMFEGADPDARFVIEGSYLDTSRYVDELAREGLEMTFVSAHRPLQAFTDALADAGLLIERLREVAFPERAIAHERSRRWQRMPLFLHLRALKVRDRLDLDERARRQP